MRLLLGLLPFALLWALAETLHVGAARDVREDESYIGLFPRSGRSVARGTAWATALLGISIRDERSNETTSRLVWRRLGRSSAA